jgi:hypothetical protein
LAPTVALTSSSIRSAINCRPAATDIANNPSRATAAVSVNATSSSSQLGQIGGVLAVDDAHIGYPGCTDEEFCVAFVGSSVRVVVM